MSDNTNENCIKVVLRLRPPNSYIQRDFKNHDNCVFIQSPQTVQLQSKPEAKLFTFDHVMELNSVQQDLFQLVGIPTVDNILKGYNGTIFAYGQTGSGKTFTMIGLSDESGQNLIHEFRGLTPRCLEYLFSLIFREKQLKGDCLEFLCKCSFLEIYNEQVFDLMVPGCTGLQMRESIDKGVYVDGITETSVTSASEALELLQMGQLNRHIGSTSMNRDSSRSHAIFTITTESKKRDALTGISKIRHSCLNLVDLAGSERQKDSKADGLRLKEAGNINRSLSSLGNVITALVDCSNGKARHVPYRDSKMTFLLRDSLGGNAITYLVATVHASANCFGETLSTLNFAKRTKMIQNRAIVNEDLTGNVMELQIEIRRLRGVISQYRSQCNINNNNSSILNDSFLTLDSNNASANEKSINELEQLLKAELTAKEALENDRQEYVEKYRMLEDICSKKDRIIQTNCMIIKFRDGYIVNLEKAKHEQLEIIEIEKVDLENLRKENKSLHELVDKNIDALENTRENRRLRAENKRMHSLFSNDTELRLNATVNYASQLEKKLAEKLSYKDKNDSRLNLSGHMHTASRVQLKVEEAKYNNLLRKYSTLEEELIADREMEKEKFGRLNYEKLSLMAQLEAAKKNESELEGVINILKLKQSIQKVASNHEQFSLIQEMLTPLSVKQSKENSSEEHLSISEDNKNIAESGCNLMSTPHLKAKGTPRLNILSPTNEHVLSPSKNSYRNNISEEFNLSLQQREPADGSDKESLFLTESKVQKLPTPMRMIIFEEEKEIIDVDRQAFKVSLIRWLHNYFEKEEQLLQERNNLQLSVKQLQQERSNSLEHSKNLQELLKTHEVDFNKERKQLRAHISEVQKRSDEMQLYLTETTEKLSVAESMQEQTQDLLKNSNEELTKTQNTNQKLLSKYETDYAKLQQDLNSVYQQTEQYKIENDNLNAEINYKEGILTELEIKYSKLEEQNQILENQRNICSIDENDLEAENERLRGVLIDNSNYILMLEEDLKALNINSKHDRTTIDKLIQDNQKIRKELNEKKIESESLNKELTEQKSTLQEAQNIINGLQQSNKSLFAKIIDKDSHYHKSLAAKDATISLLDTDLRHISEEYNKVCSAISKQELELVQTQLQKAILENEKIREEQKKTLSDYQELLNSIQNTSFNQQKFVDNTYSLQLNEYAKMVDQWENMLNEKNYELEKFRMELAQMYSVQEENATLVDSNKDLETQVDTLKKQLKHSEDKNREKFVFNEDRIKGLTSTLVHKDRACDELMRENRDFKETNHILSSKINILDEQICRLQTSEESMFGERQRLQSQLEIGKEEKARLGNELEAIQKNMDKFVGHMNIKQRIQYHMRISNENSKLKEENMKLQSDLSLRSKRISLLEKELTKSNSKF